MRPWICGSEVVCVPDWRPPRYCKEGQQCDRRFDPRGDWDERCNWGSTMRSVVDFLMVKTAEPFTVRLHGGTWYKEARDKRLNSSHFGLAGLAPPLHAATQRLMASALQCAVRRNTAGASLRLNYGGEALIGCRSMLASLNARVRAHESRELPHGQRCPHVLTTDWFASADHMKPGVNLTLGACWKDAMGPDAPLWVWPLFDDRALWLLISGIPDLEEAFQVDRKGLKAFLDLAVMSKIDTCYYLGHFGDVVNHLRTASGKTPCVRLGPTSRA